MCLPFLCVLFLIGPLHVFCSCVTLCSFWLLLYFSFCVSTLYFWGFLLPGFTGHSALCELKLDLCSLTRLPPQCLCIWVLTFLPQVCNMRDSKQQIDQHQSLAQLTPQHLAHFAPLSPFWKATFFSSDSLLSQSKTT